MKNLNYALYGAIGLGVIAGVYAFWDYSKRNKPAPQSQQGSSYANVSNGGSITVANANPITGVINAIAQVQNPTGWTRWSVTV